MSKKYPSGWYTSEQGNPFHAHGNNMSEETIKAIGAIADVAKHHIENSKCPACGNRWLHGLEWSQEKGWYCSCGWTGDIDVFSNKEKEG